MMIMQSNRKIAGKTTRWERLEDKQSRKLSELDLNRSREDDRAKLAE